MKSLKPIGLFLVKCAGIGVAYGAAVGTAFGIFSAIDNNVRKSVADENFEKGIAIGSLLEESKHRVKEEESN